MEGLNGRSDTNSLVLVVVQVEGHARNMKGSMSSPPPISFREEVTLGFWLLKCDLADWSRMK